MLKKRGAYKKIIFIAIFLVFILVGVFFVYLCWRDKMNNNEEEQLTSVEQDLKIVTETFPTSFVVYGGPIEFDDAVQVQYVNEISSENLQIKNGFEYQMIIINDIEGNTNLSDEEWLIISELVKSDNRYNFFYLGSKEFEQIQSLNILSDVCAMEQGDLSVGLVHEGEQLVTVYGTYYVNAGFSLPEALIYEQAYAIKQSNR